MKVFKPSPWTWRHCLLEMSCGGYPGLEEPTPRTWPAGWQGPRAIPSCPLIRSCWPDVSEPRKANSFWFRYQFFDDSFSSGSWEWFQKFYKLCFVKLKLLSEANFMSNNGKDESSQLRLPWSREIEGSLDPSIYPKATAYNSLSLQVLYIH